MSKKEMPGHALVCAISNSSQRDRVFDPRGIRQMIHDGMIIFLIARGKEESMRKNIGKAACIGLAAIMLAGCMGCGTANENEQTQDAVNEEKTAVEETEEVSDEPAKEETAEESQTQEDTAESTETQSADQDGIETDIPDLRGAVASADGLGDDAKFGAAGLIMAILGGSVLPPLQAMIIDQKTVFGTFPATNASFILPFICFLIVTIYGYRTYIRRSL